MAYTKNTWADGDVVTSEKLNHMEDGIKDAYEFVRIKAAITENGLMAEKNRTEIDAIVAAGNIPVIAIGDEEVIGVLYYVGKLGDVNAVTCFAGVSLVGTTVTIDLYQVNDDGSVVIVGDDGN